MSDAAKEYRNSHKAVYLDKNTWEALKKIADAERRPMTSQVAIALEFFLDSKKATA